MKITKETYDKMKQLVNDYENNTLQQDGPYLEEVKIEVERKYNPNYGDDKECMCGHSYYRHFDSYEDMASVGCKYCGCYHFVEKTDELVALSEKRVNQLQTLGYTFDHNYIEVSGDYLTTIDTYSSTEEEWNQIINKLPNKINYTI